MTPVLCMCRNGHLCSPTPNNIQRGQGACAACAGKVWDVFYVVANPTTGHVKFGITSGDPGGRLGVHRGAGYTETVRSLPGVADAAALERHVIATLRDARVLAVRGREYFDVSALPVVLDIVDSWTSSTTAKPTGRTWRPGRPAGRQVDDPCTAVGDVRGDVVAARAGRQTSRRRGGVDGVTGDRQTRRAGARPVGADPARPGVRALHDPVVPDRARRGRRVVVHHANRVARI
jgi:hypothetical protein